MYSYKRLHKQTNNKQRYEKSRYCFTGKTDILFFQRMQEFEVTFSSSKLKQKIRYVANKTLSLLIDKPSWLYLHDASPWFLKTDETLVVDIIITTTIISCNISVKSCSFISVRFLQRTYLILKSLPKQNNVHIEKIFVKPWHPVKPCP